MKNYKSFIPDNRNLGGQRQIELQQKNHLLALINTKSSINTLQAPHPHIDSKISNKKKMLMEETKYREVYETFRRVNDLKKCYIDNKPPQTINRNQYISNRIVQQKNITMQDHERNIKSLISNIDHINKNHDKKVKVIKMNGIYSTNESGHKMQSRPQSAYISKKQSIDYQDLLEIDGDSKKGVTTHQEVPTVMDYSEALIIDKNQDLTGQFDNSNQNQDNYINQDTNKTHYSSARQYSQHSIQVPYIPQSNLYDPYKELRRILLKIIMDKGQYEKQAINNLAQIAYKNNPHLELNNIKEICRQIIQQLYGDA